MSPSAVLIFRTRERFFVLTFSYGHVYVDDTKTEADFGLKVAVNAINDKKLRSIERSNIGAAIRDLAQAAGQRELGAFGVDEALDIIRRVSGNVADGKFARLVTGARSLRFSKKMELTDIPAFSVEALDLYGRTTYRDTAFRIIDFLSPVVDTGFSDALDRDLIASIVGGNDDFELALPEILATNVGTFRFERAGFSEYRADLSVELYREELGDEIGNLTVDEIKKHRIAAYSDANDTPIDTWSVYQACIGSIAKGNERYALNEGTWYRVDQAYKDSAESEFQRIKGPSDPKLLPFAIIGAQSAKSPFGNSGMSIPTDEKAAHSDMDHGG